MQKPTVETMLSDLNTNLAMGKPTLEKMKCDGDRRSKVRGGTEIEVPQEQVDLLWDACDDAQRIALRLPIYLYSDISGETGAWKVQGRVEAAVVAKLLGKPMFRDDMVKLYYPDYKQLKKLIPDAIMVVFTP